MRQRPHEFRVLKRGLVFATHPECLASQWVDSLFMGLRKSDATSTFRRLKLLYGPRDSRLDRFFSEGNYTAADLEEKICDGVLDALTDSLEGTTGSPTSTGRLADL